MQGPRILLSETLKSRLYGRVGTGRGDTKLSRGDVCVDTIIVEVESMLQIGGAPGFCHIYLSHLANITCEGDHSSVLFSNSVRKADGF